MSEPLGLFDSYLASIIVDLWKGERGASDISLGSILMPINGSDSCINHRFCELMNWFPVSV